MRKLCLSVLLVAVIAGSCSTAAQRQLNAIKDGVRAIAERDTACHRQIFNNPAYRSIAQRMPLGDQNASIAQLIEPSMATDEEAALVIAMHNEKARFREQSLAETVWVVPGIAPILTQGYNEYDLIIADLLLKKISWGEANRRIATAHQASGER